MILGIRTGTFLNQNTKRRLSSYIFRRSRFVGGDTLKIFTIGRRGFVGLQRKVDGFEKVEAELADLVFGDSSFGNS